MHNALIEPILQQLDVLCRDSRLHHVISAIVVRGPRTVTDGIFWFVMGFTEKERTEATIKEVCLALAEEASWDVSDQMLVEFVGNEEVLSGALAVCPLRVQVAFLTRNRAAVERAEGKKIRNQLLAIDSSLTAKRYTEHPE
jgi:hypothetical protein